LQETVRFSHGSSSFAFYNVQFRSNAELGDFCGRIGAQKRMMFGVLNY